MTQHKNHHSDVLALHYSEIFVPDDRIRSDAGEIRDFANQLKEQGQQNPITYEAIDGKKHLNTGFRRLSGSAILESKGEFYGMSLTETSPLRVPGPGYVLCRDIGSLDEIERLKLEMSENDGRKGFTESEQAMGYAKLQRLMARKLGRNVRVAELAAEIGKSVGQVGMGLKVAAAVEGDPTGEVGKRLLKQPSVKAAYNTMNTDKKLKELKERASKSKIDTVAEANISNEDGLAFLQSLETESVDFVNFDPPWGIDHDSYQRSPKHELYNDGEAYAWGEIIEPMIPEIARVMKVDTWGIMWVGIQFVERARKLLEKQKLKVNTIPNIWLKTNKGGSQNNADIIETNIYESYIRFCKGDPRLFKKPVSNVLQFPMDLGDEREHSAQKPVELSVEILERYTFGGMFLIDPTYGSGRIFRAAKKLGRKFAGAELSESNREKAINLLRRLD